jgi:hypothetical protein
MGPKKGTYENPIGASLEQVRLLAEVRAARARGRQPAPKPAMAEKKKSMPTKRHRHNDEMEDVTEEAKPSKRGALVGFPTWQKDTATSAASSGAGEASAAAMGLVSPYLSGPLPPQQGSQPVLAMEMGSQDTKDADFDAKCRELFDPPPRSPEPAKAPTSAKAAKLQTRQQVD